MKEKGLEKRLENAATPNIEMHSHRRRLKMELLETGCPQQRRALFPSILSLIPKDGTSIIMKILRSKQPVWKTASIGIIAMAFVITLSIALPPLFTDSVYARATEIITNSPEIRQALGTTDNETVSIVNFLLLNDDETISSILQRDGELISAEIDLEAGKVFEIRSVSLTEEERQKALHIAEEDAELKELLDNGAVITQMNYQCNMLLPSGEPEEGSKKLLTLSIEVDGVYWTANIDMEAEKVTDLRAGLPVPQISGVTFGVVPVRGADGNEMVMTVIEAFPDGYIGTDTITHTESPAEIIAKTDPDVQALLDQGATITACFQPDNMNEDGIRNGPAFARVILQLGDQYWYIDVDVDAGEVTGSLVETDKSVMSPDFPIE